MLLYNQAHKKPGSNEMEFTPFFVVMSVICQVRLLTAQAGAPEDICLFRLQMLDSLQFFSDFMSVITSRWTCPKNDN